MKRLTPKEEEVMQVLWDLKKAYVKEIIPLLPRKYHYNTVSTMVRNLETKGFIDHEAFGKTHRYFPKIQKEAYQEYYMKSASQFLFNNSYINMVSFFAREEKISADELRDILKIIEAKDNEK